MHIPRLIKLGDDKYALAARNYVPDIGIATGSVLTWRGIGIAETPMSDSCGSWSEVHFTSDDVVQGRIVRKKDGYVLTLQDLASAVAP